MLVNCTIFSYNLGMVEPACRIGYYNLHSSTTCTKEIDREMAIAFYNSDFHSNVHESDEWDDYRYYTFQLFVYIHDKNIFQIIVYIYIPYFTVHVMNILTPGMPSVLMQLTI